MRNPDKSEIETVNKLEFAKERARLELKQKGIEIARSHGKIPEEMTVSDMDETQRLDMLACRAQADDSLSAFETYLLDLKEACEVPIRARLDDSNHWVMPGGQPCQTKK